jgi:glycosyltransferase involved in cell wall biosynthesis
LFYSSGDVSGGSGAVRAIAPIFASIEKDFRAKSWTSASVFVSNRVRSPQFFLDASEKQAYSVESAVGLRGIISLLLSCFSLVRGPKWKWSAPAELQAIGMESLYRQKLKHLSRWRLCETKVYLSAYRKLLKQISPQVVVLADEASSHGQMILSICHSLDIPTIAVQHGIIHPLHFGYVHDSRDFIEQSRGLLPNKTVVFGSYFEKILREFGHYKKEKVVVTGSPKFDGFMESLSRKEEDTSRSTSAGLEGGKRERTVLLTTQPLPDPIERLSVLTATCEALKKLPGSVLIIKPHPRELDLSSHRQAIANAGIRGEVVEQVELLKILQQSDLMITQSSTSVLEALLVGCPVVTLNLTGLPEIMDFASSGACHEVTDASALGEVIEQMLDLNSQLRRNCDAKRQQYLVNMLGPLDGCASARVVSEIEKFLTTRIDMPLVERPLI